MIYARKGEQVTCQAGHPIGRFTRDVLIGEVIHADMLTGGVPADGETVGPCSCGELFAISIGSPRIGAFHFSDGWRTASGPTFYRFPRAVLGEIVPPPNAEKRYGRPVGDFEGSRSP